MHLWGREGNGELAQLLSPRLQGAHVPFPAVPCLGPQGLSEPPPRASPGPLQQGYGTRQHMEAMTSVHRAGSSSLPQHMQEDPVSDARLAPQPSVVFIRDLQDVGLGKWR